MKTMVGLPIETTHDLEGDYWVMKEEYAIPYREHNAKQLASWLEGKPKHNHFSNECCPDFSCCSPENLWPEEKRKQFAAANDEDRMLMIFGQIPDMTEKTVYLAGLPSVGETKH